jgi:hypothetical protein
MGRQHLLAIVGAATLALTAAFALAPTASGTGSSPAQLQRAGWDCLNPAGAFPANPNVHCFPPGKYAVVTGLASLFRAHARAIQAASPPSPWASAGRGAW